MSVSRPHILLVSTAEVRERMLQASDVERLRQFADLDWLECGVPFDRTLWTEVPDDPEATAQVAARVGDVDGLIVCHGSPRIADAILDAAPRLRIIGELEGDRFAARIDVIAAQSRGVRVVDTTNGSSYGVAEWALGMMLNAVRNSAELYRLLIAGGWPERRGNQRPEPGAFERFELTGKRVGLIGLGIIGRRLVQLLEPFRCQIQAHDPYVPKEVADILGVKLTNLDAIMAESDVIVCVAPITPATHRMVGARELDLIRPGSALVNVSRGPIFDPDATIARLRRGDITGAFDVWDPEPIPADSPIRQLSNVFLTPHVSSQTRDGRGRFFALMVDELDRFFHGHETLYDLTPRTLANRFGRPAPVG
ncbi:MAG: hydroxyacid dehydrogenase [Chloroflexi bacterium]|nr:hydroxyacid dehydrogenase [Chloroflexota bacterium]